MKKFFAIALFFIAIGVISSCSTSKSIAGRNLSHLYQEAAENPIQLICNHVNVDDEITRVYWKLNTRGLGISKDEFGEEQLSLTYSYRTFYSYSDPNAIDSGRVVLKDILYNKAEWLMDSIDVRAATGRNYVIELHLIDLNSGKRDQQYISVNKSQSFSNSSFSVKSSSGEMIFEPYITEPGFYSIRTDKNVERLYARFYSRDFPMASPPFAVVAPKPFNFTPDRQFELEKNGSEFILNADRVGFYQLTLDTNVKTGGTVYYYGAYYPEAKTIMDLVLPLRYITTNEEFEQINSSDNLKKSLDAYWLKIGGNADRARELIKAYYERVQIANEHFGSYIEGWKTDRGMSYIVFGPPNAVNRNSSTETWLYGEEGKYNALTLSFTKVVNPFTNNDYRLNRSASLKTPWYRAVEFWRQGRVLTYK